MTNQEPKPCARCHASGHGCCRLSASGPEYMFGLTEAEIKAMAKASGRARDEFVVADQAGPQLVDAAEALHPALARMLNHGCRQRLRVDANGECVFLGSQGCQLPRRSRPIFCRMYPVFVAPQGDLVLMIREPCPAQEGAESPQQVLKRLGQTEKDLRNLHARLLRLSALPNA